MIQLLMDRVLDMLFLHRDVLIIVWVAHNPDSHDLEGGYLKEIDESM